METEATAWIITYTVKNSFWITTAREKFKVSKTNHLINDQISTKSPGQTFAERGRPCIPSAPSPGSEVLVFQNIIQH